MRTALITGLAGPELTPEEDAFLRAVRPAGIILFARNCVGREQISDLVEDCKVAIGSADVLVAIDQEGGRVQRLRPPLGRALPPAAAFGCDYAVDSRQSCQAAFDVARLLADDLLALGINTNCAPVLDLPVAGAHDVIGNRAYGTAPAQAAALGRAVAEGLMAGGVLPVMKHIPGHGRATKDSHLDLPVVGEPRAVLSATDFAPFHMLRDLPAAMTAHVIFTDIDPERPASTSPIVIHEVVRGEIGFDGLLMSDDLSMKALSGNLSVRAEAVIAAGSDLALHCNGNIEEMRAATEGSPPLAGAALRRFQTALGVLARRDPFDRDRAEACLAQVLATHAGRTGRTESV
ncbi:MAG: beta-N-acetylhexosaminidase [Hyphomicrobium sp.]